MSKNKEEEFLRIAEAARVIGVTKRTMQIWDNKGTLKAARQVKGLGCKGGRLYTRSQLDAFIKERMERE